MINVIAIIRFDKEKLQLAEKKLQLMLAPSRAELGNIQYLLYLDVLDKEVFVFYEVWESLEVFEKHKESVHFHEFLEYANIHAKEVQIKELAVLGS
ncbi:putative quinol monooxygenase [Acinetobacter nectaris]|uniref:putative quinol monooxygenase n=1 Tax=Acinetobacter nectaris TaxID=1219382 RepID=UPI001F44DA48|nr:putative quinol monooxygenase [Acinetobacter nectaris]MCF8999171.1 antibiotic biosynthesis monooxygenase [Acinetobacter nectaris]MCF9026504.1 antibiotic biosynthesis monooxygenase [Acinetobacter nectaris]